jgi:hypothetical protein
VRQNTTDSRRIDIDGGSSALAGRQQLQALGRALARRAVRAWQHRHAAFLASALEHELGDILVFSMSGLAFFAVCHRAVPVSDRGNRRLRLIASGCLSAPRWVCSTGRLGADGTKV